MADELTRASASSTGWGPRSTGRSRTLGSPCAPRGPRRSPLRLTRHGVVHPRGLGVGYGRGCWIGAVERSAGCGRGASGGTCGGGWSCGSGGRDPGDRAGDRVRAGGAASPGDPGRDRRRWPGRQGARGAGPDRGLGAGGPGGVAEPSGPCARRPDISPPPRDLAAQGPAGRRDGARPPAPEGIAAIHCPAMHRRGRCPERGSTVAPSSGASHRGAVGPGGDGGPICRDLADRPIRRPAGSCGA